MRVKSTFIKPALVAGLLVQIGAVMGAGHAQQHMMDHSDHAAHLDNMAAAANRGVEQADVRLSDAELINQLGETVKLESDVLTDDIVVIDFIFTTCTTICPVTTALLAASKRDFDELAAVKYVSISIDPNTDTPGRLEAFAQKHKADWTFVTGQKSVIDQVLVDMDAYSTNPEDHAPMILVGDASTGDFVRMFGLPNGEEIDAHVARLRLAREHAQHGGHHGHH